MSPRIVMLYEHSTNKTKIFPESFYTFFNLNQFKHQIQFNTKELIRLIYET